MAETPSNNEYWAANIRLVTICLIIWALVSFGFGILLRPMLSGIAVGGTDNIITLKLAGPSTAKNVSYIKGGTWRQDQGIIWGSNNIAALTFCEFPIRLLKD